MHEWENCRWLMTEGDGVFRTTLPVMELSRCSSGVAVDTARLWETVDTFENVCTAVEGLGCYVKPTDVRTMLRD